MKHAKDEIISTLQLQRMLGQWSHQCDTHYAVIMYPNERTTNPHINKNNEWKSEYGRK